jgi:hypothetical protein
MNRKATTVLHNDERDNTGKHDDNSNQSNQSFTSRKMDWMTAAAYDRRLKPSDFRVAFVIAQHINKDTGKAFPSQAEIADRANTSVDTVQRTIKLLEDIRWLTIRRKRTYDPKTKSWKTRNFYWLRHENVQIAFDNIAASKLKRRYVKSRTGAPSKSRTRAPLTPSEKHLQKGRDSTEGERISSEDKSILKGKNENGEHEAHDTGRSEGRISTPMGNAPSQQGDTPAGMGGDVGRGYEAARIALPQAGPARHPRGTAVKRKRGPISSAYGWPSKPWSPDDAPVHTQLGYLVSNEARRSCVWVRVLVR